MVSNKSLDGHVDMSHGDFQELMSRVDHGTKADHQDRFLHALKQIADPDTHIDRGGGMAQSDYWVTLDGVEYFVTVQFSNNQLRKMAQ